ncbi:MAG TPA: ATP-binding protein [Pyrinomonadaceae bacterium]|nr:ATP-binding protein [Pyrinomonadaceae bacterium]
MSDEDLTTLRNSCIGLPSITPRSSAAETESVLIKAVESWLSTHGLSPSEFATLPIVRPSAPQSLRDRAALGDFTGVVAIAKSGTHRSPADFFDQVRELAFGIETGRSERLIASIQACQSALNEGLVSQDEVLGALGDLLSFEMGARGHLLVNRRTGLLEYRGHALLDQDDISIERIREVAEVHLAKGVCFLRIAKDSDATAFHELMVLAFTQKSYLLQNVAFRNMESTFEHLELLQDSEAFVVFLDKAVEGYLQDAFSETDATICTMIAELNRQYLVNTMTDEAYSQIQSKVALLGENANDSKKILEILQTISLHFSDLVALEVEDFDHKMEVDFEPGLVSSLVSQEYIERLNDKYLARLSDNQTKLDFNRVFLGVDKLDSEANAAFRIEIHIPTEGGTSPIYVARYDGQTVPSSVFKAMGFLFSEMQIQLRRLANQTERASYLMQVRHALIHHISAAHGGISAMKTLWDRGTRNKEYWSSLLSDPILSKLLPKTLWSLSQGRLLMENGRFLTGEIDPGSLNRKPLKIASIIEDSLQSLNSQRVDKALIVKSSIRGFPRPMNGDAALLGVAITNLIDNAFKYSRVRETVMWSLHYGEDSYRFRITNAGGPLDAAAKSRYFGVGFRGKQRDRLNQRHGTGLGLPVAYKILKAHYPTCELNLDSSDFDPDLKQPSVTFSFEMPYLTGQ